MLHQELSDVSTVMHTTGGLMKRCQERASRNPKTSNPLRENLRLARQLLGGVLPIRVAKSLEKLSNEFNFSLSNGEQ
jgi:hypothetical protein